MKRLLFILSVMLTVHNTIAQPANNNCSNAVTLTFTGTTASAAGTNAGATFDWGDSYCFLSARNVWYKFVAIGHNYNITVKGGTMTRPRVSLLSFPTACTGFNGYEYDCNTTATGNNTVTISGTCYLSIGRTYYVMVDNATSAGAGTFTITVTNTGPATIAGDDIDVAQSINACGINFNGTTIGATICGDVDGSGLGLNSDLDGNVSTDPFGYGDGSDVDFSVENSSWFTFCNATAGTYTISFTNTGSCTGGNGLQLAVFKGTSSNLTLLAGGYAGMNILSGSTYSTVQTFAAGTCVFILVDGYSGTNCNYSIKLTPATTCAVLPLSIIDFSGKINTEGDIELMWDVGLEKQIKKYEIQRSVDGTNYQSVGIVEAKRMDNLMYSFKDDNAVNGISYYKLLVYEDDNSSMYYSKLLLFNKSGGNEITIAPNPTNSMLYIMSNSLTSFLSVSIYSVYGQKMKQFDNTGDKSNKVALDVSALEDGVYTIKIDTGAQIVTRKFIKKQ